MPTMVVAIHVPLLQTPNLPDGAYPFPWIADVEDFLADLEEQGEVEVFDDGEEGADAYVFFLTRADEENLLTVASYVAELPGVPAAAFAVVSDNGAELFGLGRRIALPLFRADTEVESWPFPSRCGCRTKRYPRAAALGLGRRPTGGLGPCRGGRLPGCLGRTRSW